MLPPRLATLEATARAAGSAFAHEEGESRAPSRIAQIMPALLAFVIGLFFTLAQ